MDEELPIVISSASTQQSASEESEEILYSSSIDCCNVIPEQVYITFTDDTSCGTYHEVDFMNARLPSGVHRIYNMYHDACNAEWVEVKWQGNICYITSHATGCGTVRTVCVDNDHKDKRILELQDIIERLQKKLEQSQSLPTIENPFYHKS